MGTTTVRQSDNLYRGLFEPRSVTLRAADDAPAGAVMAGRFAVFNEFTEIDSWFEGRFLEKVDRGSFTKTLDDLSNVRVQYDHGYDTHIGSAPLGPPSLVTEDKSGVYYEVPLLDTDYNRDRILPLLEGRLMDGTVTGESLLGASFRFRVIRDDWDDEPGMSDNNPDGLPERTIKEVRLYEFGPVVFGAYPSATSGLRSLTDHYLDKSRSRNLGAAADPGTAPKPATPPTEAPGEPKGRPTVAAARTTIAAIGGKEK